MDEKKKILFLCTHNAARSQMAEGFINALYSDRYQAYSAGSEPTEMHSCAIKVMAEEGIDIASQRAKPLDEYVDASFDYVVTMCAAVQERCPIF
ncbi:MAG: arsenate reductase ArsC, partial [Halobacteriota archaeon]